jgi:hypothetical protein
MLADEVDRGEQRLTFDLKAKKYPVITAEKLQKQEEAAIALGQRFLDEWKRLNEPPSNGWIEHGEALSCGG